MENLKAALGEYISRHSPEGLPEAFGRFPAPAIAEALLSIAGQEDELVTVRSRAVRGLGLFGALDESAWLAIIPRASKELFQEWLAAWADPADRTLLSAEHVRAMLVTHRLPKSTTGFGKAVRAFIERGAGFTSAVFLPGSAYPGWEVKYDCVRTIIAIGDADSLRTLAAFSTMSYWKARRRIIEYIQDQFEAGRLSPEDKPIAIGILEQITTDGKSDEKTPTLRIARELLAQLTTGISALMPISESIAAVLAPGGRITGSAFMAAPRLLLTCAHVILSAGSQPEGSVTLRFHTGDLLPARVDPAGWRPAEAEDIAVLVLEGDAPPGALPLPVGDSASAAQHDFRSFGYPSASEVIGLYARGEILGLTRTEQGLPLLQLKAQQLAPGHSGAPVWDEQTRCVVGMVSQVYRPGDDTKNRDTAFAIPAEALSHSLALHQQNARFEELHGTQP